MNQPFLYVGRDADKLSEHLGGEIKKFTSCSNYETTHN